MLIIGIVIVLWLLGNIIEDEIPGQNEHLY